MLSARNKFLSARTKQKLIIKVYILLSFILKRTKHIENGRWGQTDSSPNNVVTSVRKLNPELTLEKSE